MSNLQMARFLSTIMWQLACMIVLGLHGNNEGAIECERDFWNTMKFLDELEEGGKHDA